MAKRFPHMSPGAAPKAPPPARPNPWTGATAPDAGPNLLVTIDERHRDIAGGEVLEALSRAGYADAEIVASPASGMIGVRMRGADAREAIPRLRALLAESPFAFQHTHRWLPIEAWERAEAAELRRFAEQAAREIGPESTWGIRLERHQSQLDRGLIVNTLAQRIDNPHVELSKPDKTLMVEVCGDRAGLAVLRDDQILNVDRVMREEFLTFEEIPSLAPEP